MLVDSEPQEECDQSENWVMVGKAKHKMGGVKQVSNLCVKRNDNTCPTSLMWNAPTHQKTDPHCLLRGGFILSTRNNEYEKERNWNWQTEYEDVLLQETGGVWMRPLGFTGLWVE